MTAALQDIVNKIAQMKNIRLKGNSKPWFDSDIMDAIWVRGKLNEILLRTKLHVDHERFKELQQKTKNKKTNLVRNQLQNNTKSPRNCGKYSKILACLNIKNIFLKKTKNCFQTI